MMRCVVILFLIALWASPARAILPPDAKAREPQLRAQHLRARQKYDQRQVERQEEAVEAYQTTKANLFTPPWMRMERQMALQVGLDVPGAAEKVKMQKRNNRFMTSVVLLILIGFAAGWAWYKTRKIDE
jgi:hypothetical protein